MRPTNSLTFDQHKVRIDHMHKIDKRLHLCGGLPFTAARALDAGKPIACLFFRYATFLRFGLMSVNGDHLDKQEQVP